MKIGSSVIVNRSNSIYDDFFGVTGTVTETWTGARNIQKSLVRFDEPILVENKDYMGAWWESEADFFDSYDFMDTCLDLI